MAAGRAAVDLAPTAGLADEEGPLTTAAGAQAEDRHGRANLASSGRQHYGEQATSDLDSEAMD
jgi:hypothetical protein